MIAENISPCDGNFGECRDERRRQQRAESGSAAADAILDEMDVASKLPRYLPTPCWIASSAMMMQAKTAVAHFQNRVGLRSISGVGEVLR